MNNIITRRTTGGWGGGYFAAQGDKLFSLPKTDHALAAGRSVGLGRSVTGFRILLLDQVLELFCPVLGSLMLYMCLD